MEQKFYRYYSTQRPVDLGTFPKPPGNAPVEIHNFDERIPIEGESFLVWGFLEYAKPLTAKDAWQYELRPACTNPDMQHTPKNPGRGKAPPRWDAR